ncbi:MAG: helix-hairpin-helix domain-containing protein [Chitinophagales bacterium]|nr:helix-hairpin-helix domain-containing protein [Chitinophagales bacterium]
MWKKFAREYLMFTRWERNGLIILLVAILLIIFFPQVAILFYREKAPDFTPFKNQIDSFEKKVLAEESKEQYNSSRETALEPDRKPAFKNEKSANAVFFFFDPNTLSAENFKKLGLDNRVIGTILKYRSKGGKFFRKEDLKKIYGLSNEVYESLSPYIQIPNRNRTADITPGANKVFTSEIKSVKTFTKTTLLDLNTADSLQLDLLPGIGSVLSSRIIKYRNRIGGFYSSAQLLEVYGLLPETFEEIKGRIMVDTSIVEKININTATLDMLKKHPYFKYPVANTIVSYRQEHGAFTSLEQLKNVDAVSDDLYYKIIPYIEL